MPQLSKELLLLSFTQLRSLVQNLADFTLSRLGWKGDFKLALITLKCILNLLRWVNWRSMAAFLDVAQLS